jgi:hypothetical protein
MKSLYDSLFLTVLSDEQVKTGEHMRYRYLITNGATSRTAYETKQGLMRYLEERGLTLAEELPQDSTKTHSMGIKGAYIDEMHMDYNEFYGLRDGALVVTKTLSNGDYTLALITEESGTRTVHSLNPNCIRYEFDHHKARKEMM